MKKRILTALLALCMVFALGTVSALAYEETTLPTAENGKITFTSDVTISIGDLSTALDSQLENSNNKLEIDLSGLL